jgi:hypothetical protein
MAVHLEHDYSKFHDVAHFGNGGTLHAFGCSLSAVRDSRGLCACDIMAYDAAARAVEIWLRDWQDDTQRYVENWPR